MENSSKDSVVRRVFVPGDQASPEKETPEVLSRGKVFIPQEPTRYDEETRQLVNMMNFKKAAEYGDPVVCMPPGPVALSPAPTEYRLRECLKGFSDDDYLIAVGDASLIAIAAMIASDENRGRVNLLKYDKDTKRYIKVSINIHRRVEKED